MNHNKHKLHPGAKWLFRIKGYFGAFFLMIFFSWFMFPLIAIISKVGGGGSSQIVTAVLLGMLFYIILIILIAEIYARMSYNRWFYEFTSDSLRLERGIIWKRYSNVPYERVQNVDIYRGILARMIGFSSVMIQTAGYSYHPRGGGMSEGYLPAINPKHAEEIREFLMKKISHRRGGGV
ncbi:MAG: PH domain-containing protein [Nanoarchaeota archaeon]|nr:PH domain-containing protein [Nanoarchaeota archaeon]